MTERALRVFQFIEGGARYGAAVSVLNVASALRDAGAIVEFGVFAGKPLAEVLRQQGFVVHEVPARSKFDFRAVRYLSRLLREHSFDVVHTHLSKATIMGSIAGRLARVPVVATVHGMNKKYTYLLATRLITVSEAAKRHLVAQGMRDGRITPVYNAIPTDPFDARPSAAEAKRAFGFPPESVVIGTVSRAHKQKGVELAIDAVAELRGRGHDAKYLFVGDGPHMEEFKSYAASRGLEAHVEFPGFSDSILPALAAMDIFMFPTYREAFGISLLEAMAAEVPVIASAVDGVPEVLAGDSGILLHAPTSVTLADAAESIVTDPQLRATIVQNARRRVETEFSLPSVASAVVDVYRSVIAESGRAVGVEYDTAT